MLKSILVVVDMQNDFIQGSLGSSEAVGIVENVKKKIEEHKNKGSLIVATLDTHDNNYLSTLEGKLLPVPHCIEGSWGHEINEEVKLALPLETLYAKKTTFASFSLIDYIGSYIKSEGSEQNSTELEIIGLCTDICVVSNALLLRSAFPNMKITVFSNACAGTTKEKHFATLEVMKSCQINVD